MFIEVEVEFDVTPEDQVKVAESISTNYKPELEIDKCTINVNNIVRFNKSEFKDRVAVFLNDGYMVLVVGDYLNFKKKVDRARLILN